MRKLIIWRLKLKFQSPVIFIAKNKKIGMYSLGQKKLAIFRILSELEFDILILDEYLTNLDENNLEEIITILKRLENKNTTVIISTNDIEIKNKFTNKILINNKIIKVKKDEQKNIIFQKKYIFSNFTNNNIIYLFN